MNFNPRLMAVRDLKMAHEDVMLELEDVLEELSVHEQYKPNTTIYSAWVGTTEEWSDEWGAIKANALGLEKTMHAIARELDRRTELHNTRTAVAQSAIYSKRQHIVFLEDHYINTINKQDRKAQG